MSSASAELLPTASAQQSLAWRNAWYPVAFLRDLDPDRPTGFTLLGDDLVLWFDRKGTEGAEAAGGQWRAFADVCPHRLVPLSEGRLNAAGELECPYHGWSFDGQGRCTAIPQASGGSQPSDRRSSCRAYTTATGQDMLFVFAGASEVAAAVPLPLVPVLEDKQAGWLVQDTFRDLPYDALTLLENVLDVSHVPFTHHATVGRRETAGPVDLRLEQAGPEGFSGVWEEGPRRGKLGSQFTTFLAPGLMWHDLTARGFARILTVVYATPTRPGSAGCLPASRSSSSPPGLAGCCACAPSGSSTSVITPCWKTIRSSCTGRSGCWRPAAAVRASAAPATWPPAPIPTSRLCATGW